LLPGITEIRSRPALPTIECYAPAGSETFLIAT
jgi:hypothetical protein